VGDEAVGSMTPDPASGVTLRRVRPTDLDVFFVFMQDPGAITMAAFTPEDPADRAAFDAHWDRILQNETVTMRAVVVHGEVAGNIGSYASDTGREVTYWIGRTFWGTGNATEALRQFLEIDTRRPMYARVVTDNLRSIRVLESNGFSTLRTDEGFAHGRGETVTEHIMQLR
jgi:RimJ/RimL family protein N-acetyltransferase